MGQAEQAAPVLPVVGHHPHDEGCPEDDQHVARAVGAGHDLFAEGIDRTPGEGGVGAGHRPDPSPHRTHHRQLILGHPELVEGRPVPTAPGVEVPKGHGGGRVHRRDRGEGVGGHGLAVPVAAGIRLLGDRPPEHPPALFPLPPGVTRRPDRGPVGTVLPRPGVAVEQTGQQWTPPPVDRGDRRDHRGHHHTGGGAVELGRDRGERPLRATPPRLGHVVLEEVGARGAHSMRDAGPGHHGAVGVDGHRLHRGGAHVDAYGADAALRPAHEPDILFMRRHYGREPAPRPEARPASTGTTNKELATRCPNNDPGPW